MTGLTYRTLHCWASQQLHPGKVLKLLLLVLLLGATMGIVGENLTRGAEPIDGHASAAGYDRPAGDPHQSRSAVVAQHGIVATSQPLASQAGLAVLRAGGTAADAAVAANAVLGVVEPMSCGIGGDLYVLYWEAKTEKLYGLNASGRSPRGLTREMLRKQGEYNPETGPLSWSVPGCVSGWGVLLERFGSKPLPEILAAAIDYADKGFGVSEIIAGDWQSSAKSLSRYPTSAATFLPGGHAPRVGELFRNPRLAASLRQIAASGPSAFYQGPIAEQIVAYSQSVGGYFSSEDFVKHTSDWVEPVSTNYRGYDVWQIPPPGQGIAVLEMLNLLEGYDLRALGHDSAEYLHRLVEAKKLVYADRARYYADPAFADVPTAELISKPYAERRRTRIDLARAATDVPAGDPRQERGDTVYLTVVDKDRNCCSFIQSNFYGFGSQMVPGELGFVLQNRGSLFSLADDHPNRFEPGKRPFHTIIPGMVTRDGKPWLSFGVMGGDMQPQGQVQVLVNMIDFGMNVQQAGDAARVRHLGSASPTGQPASDEPNVVLCESGVPAAAVAGLRAKGHNVKHGEGAGGFGGYQGIWIDLEHGTLQGGTDPRKDGAAVGY
ncbi:MAG: gamma-glutamyltransferase [Pirellulales bacterium]|nr:gamma-glutamyltransferase [Pirellulales bacterium]